MLYLHFNSCLYLLKSNILNYKIHICCMLFYENMPLPKNNN